MANAREPLLSLVDIVVPPGSCQQINLLVFALLASATSRLPTRLRAKTFPVKLIGMDGIANLFRALVLGLFCVHALTHDDVQLPMAGGDGASCRTPLNLAYPESVSLLNSPHSCFGLLAVIRAAQTFVRSVFFLTIAFSKDADISAGMHPSVEEIGSSIHALV